MADHEYSLRKELFDVFTRLDKEIPIVPEHLIENEVTYLVSKLPAYLYAEFKEVYSPEILNLEITSALGWHSRADISDEQYDKYILPALQKRIGQLGIQSRIEISNKKYCLAIPITELKKFCNYDKLQLMT